MSPRSVLPAIVRRRTRSARVPPELPVRDSPRLHALRRYGPPAAVAGALSALAVAALGLAFAAVLALVESGAALLLAAWVLGVAVAVWLPIAVVRGVSTFLWRARRR